jgi:hypothetical protein
MLLYIELVVIESYQSFVDGFKDHPIISNSDSKFDIFGKPLLKHEIE